MALINRVTHQEIQLLYSLSYSAARKKLCYIRQTLKKTRKHTLTVLDFCKVEDMTVTDFDDMMTRAKKI